MTTTTAKWFWGGVVVLSVLGGLAWFGFTPFLHNTVTNEQTNAQVAGSSAGTLFSTAKVAEIAINPTVNAATSTSILNGDANDRIIDSSFVSCATSSGAVTTNGGSGVATWNWLSATTSTSALGLQGNTNYAMNITVPTSTTDNSYVASSTSPASVRNRLWPSGSYLTFNINASSSNATLTCQVGSYYHAT